MILILRFFVGWVPGLESESSYCLTPTFFKARNTGLFKIQCLKAWAALFRASYPEQTNKY